MSFQTKYRYAFASLPGWNKKSDKNSMPTIFITFSSAGSGT